MNVKWEEIDRLLDQGKKIQAVAKYREQAGVGLRSSMVAVDMRIFGRLSLEQQDQLVSAKRNLKDILDVISGRDEFYFFARSLREAAGKIPVPGDVVVEPAVPSYQI